MAKYKLSVKETLTFMHEIIVEMNHIARIEEEIEYAIEYSDGTIDGVLMSLEEIDEIKVLECNADKDGGVPEFKWCGLSEAE